MKRTNTLLLVALVNLLLAIFLIGSIFKWGIIENLKIGFIKNGYEMLRDTFQTINHNVHVDMLPQKPFPSTAVRAESSLTLFYPPLFGNFCRKDWDEFWDSIYGRTIEKESASKSLIKKKRLLTKEEIEERLIDSYDIPFIYFNRTHWKEFWEILT